MKSPAHYPPHPAMSVRGLLAASQALNLALVAIIAYLCVGGTRENLSLGVMRGAVKPMTSVMPSMRSPMMGVSRMVRPGVPTFGWFGIGLGFGRLVCGTLTLRRGHDSYFGRISSKEDEVS
eukprot:760095-Amorphochlora_amoeboformis.AAC.1